MGKVKRERKEQIKDHEEELRLQLANVDFKEFAKIGPRNNEFQAILYKKAVLLVAQVLDLAISTTKDHVKFKALDAFFKYRAHLNTDTTYVIESILKCSPEQ